MSINTVSLFNTAFIQWRIKDFQ